MLHPVLGDRAKDVMMGEFAGTAASMVVNALFHPLPAAVIKFLGGFGFMYYGLKRTDPTGVAMWEAGLRMVTSTLEQISYAQQAAAIVEGARAVAAGRGREVILSDWIKGALAKTYSAPVAYAARTVATGDGGGGRLGVFKVEVKEEQPAYVPVV